MYLENRQAIEKFFDDLEALDEKLAQQGWGECSGIHYAIEGGHLKKRIWENYPVAASAIAASEGILSSWTLFTEEQREAKDQLERHDPKSYQAWWKDFGARNSRRAALATLGVYVGIDVPPIPAPSAEAVERSHAVWSHKIGGPIDIPKGGQLTYGPGRETVVEVPEDPSQKD